MTATLPNGWTSLTLGEIGKWGSGGTPSRSNSSFYIGSIPWFKTGELGPRVIYKSEESISEEAIKASSAKIFPAGSIALAMYGATIGKTSILGVDAATNQACAVVIEDNRIVNKEYLFNYLKLQKDGFIAAGQGGAQPNISQTVIKAWPIPLAPLNEQRRIAEKLDTTLARVDALNDRLARITPLLKRFRQSVLAAATSGRLTEDWRGTSSIESWQAKKLIEVCESISDGDHQAPPQSLEGIPFITISAINNGFLDIKKATRNVPESYYEALDDKRKAKIGDVLFSVTGSISIPALVNDNLKFAFQRHIAILRPKIDLISSKFLYFLLGSESIKKQANSVATGTAQLTIPLKGLRIFHISLPTLEEQTEIVRRVETLFAFADRLEARLQSAQTAAERLTPALLAKAFRGELVPQDPNDEPATELLRRLRAARAADIASKPKRGRAAKASTVSE